MVSLKQVQLLEEKVDSVVQRVTKLQFENSALRSRNSELKGQNEQLVRKVADLQEALSLYEMDKDRIEQGVERALQRLNTIENTVMRSAAEDEHEQSNDAAMRAVDEAFAPSGESLVLNDPESEMKEDVAGFVFDNGPSSEGSLENDLSDGFSASFDETSVNDDDLEAALAAGASLDMDSDVSSNFDLDSDEDDENASEEDGVDNSEQQFSIY